MAYTPELNIHHSATLRRIAWAMGMPMTKAIGEVFDYLGSTLDPKKVCYACRDKSKCHSCSFNRKGNI
ncbi:MAG: hypothetical protein KKE62_06370 [Proteobacteria bacterium]|nr:hypothetical protein [Pseudomonadota bacterium]MBU1542454.1 hypothetical protein [Pseudomonadota bacterium]MBU2431102.1 hypothetical protein [Pseudomonadota bacterium]